MTHSRMACRIAAAVAGTHTAREVEVLDALGPGPKGMSELLPEVARPAKTPVLDILVNQDLVSRDPNPDDRRIVLCRLTPKGQAEIDAVWSDTRRVLAEVSEELAPSLTGGEENASWTRLLTPEEATATALGRVASASARSMSEELGP